MTGGFDPTNTTGFREKLNWFCYLKIAILLSESHRFLVITMKPTSIIVAVGIGFLLGIIGALGVLSIGSRLSQTNWYAFVMGLGPEAWSAVAAVVVMFVAIITLPIAAYQVWISRKQHQAGVLLELDQRWESSDLLVARQDLDGLIDTIDRRADEEKNGQAQAIKRSHSEDLFASQIASLVRSTNDEDTKKYQNLIRVLNFIETMGYVAKSGYLDKHDIIEVFGGVLLTNRRVFHRFITAKQERAGTTGKAWEYSQWLFGEVWKVWEDCEKANKMNRHGSN
jgi:hypothetical protein